MSRDDDAIAAEKVVNGDIEAFHGIVRRNQGRLLSFARRFFRNIQDAEDFVQEVFLQAFRRLSTYRGDSRFASWLLTVAYNLAIRIKRRKPDYASLESEEIPDTRGDPERSLVVADARRAVVRAIRSLPERFGTCVDMFFFFGMSYETISETTGIPMNTVRSHIRRAKIILRDSLEGNVPEATSGM